MLLPAKARLRWPTCEWFGLRGFVRVLLTLVDLLLELLRLFLVCKTQPSHAVLQFKAVEKGSILVVLESVVDLLVPDDATVGRRDIYQLDEVGIAHEVVCQDCSTLQASVYPSTSVRRVRNVQLGDCDGVDLVGRFGYGALHRLLVVV